MKIPILFVIGDTEGHDKLCGKYLNRVNAECICRYCNTKWVEIQDISTDFKLTAAPQIAEWSQRYNGRDTERLKSLSYRQMTNAFTPLKFCDPKLGINGATVAEVLHLIQHGLFLYINEALFGQKRNVKSVSRNSKKSRKPRRKLQQKQVSTSRKKVRKATPPEEDVSEPSSVDGEDDGEEGEADSSETEVDESLYGKGGMLSGFASGIPKVESESRVGVFTASVKAQFNNMSKIYGRLLCHQSDRDYERAYFSSGITSGAKKNGHEERCVLLLSLIVFCSKAGLQFDKSMGETRLSNFILILSQLLLIENYFRSTELRKGDVVALKAFIPFFLESYGKICARTVGVGMNFIKFHLLLHTADDILRFGPLYSSDSSAGESMHKVFKDDARHTQKNTESFDMQTATRNAESHAIHRAIRERETLKPVPTQHKTTTIPLIKENSDTVPSCMAQGAKWFVDRSGMFVINNKKSLPTVKPTPASWIKTDLMVQVTDFINEFVLPFVPCGRVVLKSEVRVNGILYRADPGCEGRARHDWVNVQWSGSHGEVPGQIISLLDLSDVIVTPSSEHSKAVAPTASAIATSGQGVYAIIVSAEQNLYTQPDQRKRHGLLDYKAHQATGIMYWSEIEHTPIGKKITPQLHLVNCADTFVSPVIAVPYDLSDSNDIGWLFIEPRHKWNDILHDLMREYRVSRNKRKPR